MEKEKGLKLFGVRIEIEEEEEEEVMKKSYSTGNLASCAAAEQAAAEAADHGYLSDGGLAQNSRTRARQERKRGVPWTEEEHRSFLAGLEKLGKGDWRGISRNFVGTRTPTQVASHAQKYFLRQSNPNKKKRRSSLFDVGISDNAAPTNIETPVEPSTKKLCVAADKMNHQSQDSHLVNAPSSVAISMVTQVAEAPPPMILATNNIHSPTLHNVNLLGASNWDHQANARFFSKSPDLEVAPDFLQLSQPSFPIPQPANSPSIETSDLELSIAPPQPHPLAKLLPEPGSGAIRVI